ncbi:hypothetical protein QBC42DRAFT_307115 [Cladorrhinum samala]|uniref:Iron-sulfur assembly protein 1 n=1 Tax=Cladorrhinum samala TaxID=585594 RepID=A0AAV9HMS1_9PEZI|nr:hypothetical protein QBC42DRAFT_307115 [Cladorrhinum samala]
MSAPSRLLAGRSALSSSYTLPTQTPPAPRNASTPDTSITHPIQSPALPRVHETRPPKGAQSQPESQPQPQPRPAVSIPEKEAQQSQPVAAPQPPASTSSSPSSSATPNPTSTPTPRPRSRLRTPRKAAMKLTSSAVEQLRALLDQPDPKLIKVGVRNKGCSGLAYHLEYVDKPGAFDESVEQDGVKVLIDSKALFSIIGSEMDWVEDKLSQRFVFRNPNIKEQCGCGESFMVRHSLTIPLLGCFAHSLRFFLIFLVLLFLPLRVPKMVVCPICNRVVKTSEINNHIDSGCTTFLVDESGGTPEPRSSQPVSTQNAPPPPSTQKKRSAATFFQTPAAKRQAITDGPAVTPRPFNFTGNGNDSPPAPQAKRSKTNRSAPMAERMRPHTLDEVFGQDLVGPNGVLRSLIETDRVPSMILWGGSGTGKTTIARCIARRVGSRFIELNATSTGVAEVKKYFAEAANELALTGRKTIIFCDEIHRFSKSQQDVFLKPVEAGTITLIGATTENPSFKVQSALLSRCRTFTLQSLTREDIQRILLRALQQEVEEEGLQLSPLIDEELLTYLSAFADGDARTALNLLELALSLTVRPSLENGGGGPLTKEDIKASLTKTLVYDRAGDQHYDTISAFHKSVRGSDADAALYYLARMLQSGEDPLFIARRMVVIASEDVGLADNTLLPLATATYTATQQIGMPEARIPLAHCTVALCLAPKSTRAYRALNNAFSALQEPGVASLPVPLHLRNAPTRLMREMGYGGEYKYPPNYRDGKVRQEYLPEGLRGRKFLEERDLGLEVDPDVAMEEDEGDGDSVL